MAEFQFEIVTAERRVIATDVESVLLPGVNGQIGIYCNHAPILTALSIGIVEFGPKHKKKRKAAVSGGFAEMGSNKLTIFAHTAELAEEIDVLRAKEAQERAQRRLQQKREDLDFQRARIALEKAINRIKAAEG